jgi:carboxymethylenebutenolidase
MAERSSINPVQTSSASFLCEGRRVTVHHFAPAVPAHAAVLVLHGSGGSPDGSINQRAQRLASAGFLALVIRYFERTGTVSASDDDMHRHFDTWVRTVIAAVDYAAALPKITDIGMIGFSLGAYLALTAASQDRRVHAVVDYYGGLPDLFAAATTAMPPLLILHGQKDPTVPVCEAHKIARLMDQLGAPYEMNIYPDAGHEFTGADSEDAAQRSIAFFHKHLSR